MNKLQKAKQRISLAWESPLAVKLRDVRNLTLYLFLLIVFAVVWSSVEVLQRNYRIQKQISELQQRIDVQTLENENMKLRADYLKSDQYLELSARQFFGKAAPGETVLNIPKDVAEKYSASLKIDDESAKKTEKKQQTNLEAWYDFFFPNR